MARDTRGHIFDIKRYAIHDGAGIRTTVFFKGCPIRCRWCANPESQKNSIELAYISGECIQCGGCVNACPQNALKITDAGVKIDRRSCDVCGKCVAICPAAALQLMGRTVSLKELYAEVASDRPFWERSGGGVTISGGEPLAQIDFAKDFLMLCRENYIHTAIETSLHVPTEALKAVLPHVNQVICDIKIMDDDKHKVYTGASNQLILKNIAEVLSSGAEVLVRMPLIPGVNDDQQNLEAVGTFLEKQRSNVQLELLPYHRMGEDKYKRLDRSYEMDEIQPSTLEEMAKAIEILAKFDISVIQPNITQTEKKRVRPDSLAPACSVTRSV